MAHSMLTNQISALLWTTGGKHSAPPRTTVGDTLRRPGQRARSLCADPDGAERLKI